MKNRFLNYSRRALFTPLLLAGLFAGGIGLERAGAATNFIIASPFSGERLSTNTYNQPLFNTNANNIQLGERFDYTVTETNELGEVTNSYPVAVESCGILIFDLNAVPPANFSTNSRMRIRYSNPSGSTWFSDVPGADLDAYGIGWGSSPSDSSQFPVNTVFKNDDVESDGMRIADNWIPNGQTVFSVFNMQESGAGAVNEDTLSGVPGTALSRRTALASFLNTRPSGPTGRYAFFRLNLDTPIADTNGAPNNRWINLKAGTVPALGLDYTVTAQLITNFTTVPAVITAGESVQLSWLVDAGVTNVTITPGVGDVTGLTTGGVGSTIVTPANDVAYTLTASKDGQSQVAFVYVPVRRPLAPNLIDQWLVTPTSVLTNESGFVTNWISVGGREAIEAQEFNPTATLMPAATFNGSNAVYLNNSFLRVTNTSNPLNNQPEYTIALVVRGDLNSPPTANNNAWDGNSGIVDANSSFNTTDWGVSARLDGRITHGVGQFNTVLSTPGRSVVDGKFHVVVAQYGGEGARVFVDGSMATVGGIAEPAPRFATDAMVIGSIANATPGDFSKSFRGDVVEMLFYSEQADTNEVQALSQALADKYGIILNPTWITNFTANPAAINPGGSATLSWVVDSGVTNVTISGVGDVTGATVGGVGSTSVSPSADTIYTLTATRLGYDVSATVLVEVQQGLDGTLVDLWEAAAADVGFYGFPLPESLSAWTSKSNRVANTDFTRSQNPPAFITNATPNNLPAIYFTNGVFAYDPFSSGLANPVGGQSEFTLAIVFKVDTNQLPPLAGNNWWNSAGLVDAEQVGLVTADWGTGIKANGGVALGIGGPDTTLATGNGVSVLDGGWHVFVGQWGPGGMSAYIDDRGPTTLASVPTAVRNDAFMYFGAINGADYSTLANTNKFFQGWISEIRFYNDKVSPAAVDQLFTQLGSKYAITYPPEVPTTPTNLTYSVSGNTLTLSWPANYLGWILQSQTNALSTGLSGTWFDWPGSAAVTTTNLTINPADPTVFFRLRNP
jgi:hypothetical protein